MKFLRIAVLICLPGAVAPAQEVSPTLQEAPGVAVMQKNWHVEVRHPALDEDPFLAGREATQSERAKKETIRVNVINKQIGRDVAPLPNAQPSLINSDGPSKTYVYQVKIMNTGGKTIRALVWDYIFFDPDTQQEVGHHLYRSEISLQPGKSKKLNGLSQSPQTSVVDVAKTDKELQRQYSDRVVINRIEYADGSFWQRDPN
jgi:hypothetical protein